MNTKPVCKNCIQTEANCICRKVDTFFDDCWYLMHEWPNQSKLRACKIVPNRYIVKGPKKAA